MNNNKETYNKIIALKKDWFTDEKIWELLGMNRVTINLIRNKKYKSKIRKNMSKEFVWYGGIRGINLILKDMKRLSMTYGVEPIELLDIFLTNWFK